MVSSCLLIAGHVPCMPDEKAAQSWWCRALHEVPAAYRQWPRILLVDANARVGSLTSQAIGSHQASEENAHGAMMHQWIVDHHMFAPQTMSEHHDGEAATFAHATGAAGRIDFVLLDECFRHPDLRTSVLDIDLAVQRPDHYAVAADVPMHFWQRSHRHRISSRREVNNAAPDTTQHCSFLVNGCAFSCSSVARLGSNDANLTSLGCPASGTCRMLHGISFRTKPFIGSVRVRFSTSSAYGHPAVHFSGVVQSWILAIFLDFALMVETESP